MVQFHKIKSLINHRNFHISRYNFIHKSHVNLQHNLIKCRKKTPYVICKPKLEEYPKILEVMERSYFREEPSLKFLGITMNSAMEKRIVDRLNEGNSLVAKCKYTGKLLGVAMNQTVKPWNHRILENLAREQTCPKTRELFLFYSYLQEAPKLFQKYHCLFEIFEITNVFLEKNERRYKLGILLTKECVNLAIRNRFKLVRCDATNFVFSQLLEKLKFNLVTNIPYEDYVNENGVNIFENVEVPNVGVRVFTLDIRNMKEYSHYVLREA
ncbi:hypothetical protein HHI36_009562 [Cryptolaemus montrouzieri]|uniref:N-acetyltransferase domain-containing protein n=1 Tax=Cryptolaemus montrouzieri TaxID=559131 RepID=A0ABD2MG42_9CUCU